jgi:hypothetical protein
MALARCKIKRRKSGNWIFRDSGKLDNLILYPMLSADNMVVLLRRKF